MPSRSAAGVALIAAGMLLATGRLAAQQPPHWRFFTSSDGLRESWVLDVTSGSNGRWWITHGNVDTLSVFDGYTMRQLPSPGATVAVREGPTGQLWSLLPHPTVLDVYVGLQVLEHGKWTAYPLRGLPATAASMRRWHFMPWAHDRVLVLCPDALIEFDRTTGVQTTRLRAADTGLRAFTELTPAADGGAWIGGHGAIGRLAPPGTGPLALVENRAPPAWGAASVVRIHEAGADAVFASMQAGGSRAVLRVDPRTWRELAQPAPGSEDRIESWEGLPGEVWTARSAIRSFQLQVGERAGPAVDVERTSALSGRLNAVRSAGQGAFWLATSLGLARHAPAAWRSPPELGKAVGHVATLYESRRGELYALHERHLLRRVGDAWTMVPLPDRLRPDVSFTDNIAELPDGRILFGAYEGQGERIAFDGPTLPTFDPRTGHFATVRHPEGRRLQLVAAGTPGRSWVITGSGGDTRLETFDGQAFTPVFDAGRRWVSRPRSLVEGPDGEIVIVADGTGIGRWRRGTYDVLGREAGYPGSGPFCVLGLGGGRYWFGDRDSVIELASNRFRTLRSGLQGVRSLTRGRDGTIWVASGSGLHAYRDGSWLTITDADGLPAGSAYDVLQTRSGDLWASTTSGLSRYAPDADRDPPETFLDEAANVRQAPPNGEARLIFGGRDRWNYTLPDRLLYAWRIDGQTWSPLQTEAVASLAHLASGPHTFEVRAVDRNWNVDPTPARFEFVVLLPWYRATGFLVVGTLGLLALGLAVGLLVTRYLRLERLVAERTSALADSNQQLRRELDDRERMETERARLEVQLHQSQKLEALGRLAGGIAHDFNNLLTVVSSYSELMAADLPADSPQATPTREIAKAAERAAALTRQLLGFGRHQVMRPEVLDLNDVVGDIGRMLKRLLGEDVDLQYRLGPDLWGIMADRGSIEQMIVNLAVNARDAMPHGGKLTIETSNVTLDAAFARVHVGVQPGAYVLLTVSDTGVGMSDDTRTRVFEPFFTTKEAGRGTGLGLATVYGIVTQARGHIWVYSEPGRGATFTIHLPRTEADRADRPAPASPAALGAVQGRETILLVEDDEAVRELTATILRSRGFVVVAAASGEEAETVMARDGHRIDLILSDIVLSGMSGPNLVERLHAAWPDLRVVFMSGYADDAVVRHGLLEREVAFVQKPFVPDVLLRKIRETLDGAGAAGHGP
jgi:signal transduction histidine kinase/ActR/RegA family two-component response regulator